MPNTELEDSDVPEVPQPRHDEQKPKRRGRLWKSTGTPDDEELQHIADGEPGPSSGLRPRSSRCAATKVARHLSLPDSSCDSKAAGAGAGSDSDEDWEDSGGAAPPGEPQSDAEASSDPPGSVGNGSGSDGEPECPDTSFGTRRRCDSTYSTRQPAGSRTAAAGELFRKRRRSAKPPPNETAVAAARERDGRRQEAQAASPTASDGSDYEPPECSPPIQDFIADSEPESGSQEEGGPHLGAVFSDGGNDPESPPVKQRNKKQTPKAQPRSAQRRDCTAAGAPMAAAAAAAADVEDSGAAGPSQPAAKVEEPSGTQLDAIQVSSDDADEPLVVSPGRRSRRRSACAASPAEGKAAAEPAAAASGPARVEEMKHALEGWVHSSGTGFDGAAPAAARPAGGRSRLRRLSRADSPGAAAGRTEATARRLREANSGPFERQRTLHGFFAPRSAPANELEDDDAPEPVAAEDSDGSLADFIEEDEEDDDGDGGSSDDDDPVPAALEALRSSLGDGDRDVHLAGKFAEMACGLLHKFFGAPMDRQLEAMYKEALYRIKSELETSGHEAGGGLGWVNAEKNGVIDAIRSRTFFTTGHAFYGLGGTAEHYTEDDRDGRFTCDVCGRSQGGVKPISLSRKCRHDAEAMQLHSRSPQKTAARKRRRPASDDDEDGDSDGTGQGRMRFWVGSECVQRVMLRTLLQHWTCLFADKLQHVSGSAIQAAQGTEDKQQAVADEMHRRDAFFRFWCGHLRKTLGLVKKLETRPDRRGFQGTGAEVISLRSQFDE